MGETLASHRTSLHIGQKSRRPLSEGYEEVGLAGEKAFSIEFGLPMDTTDRIAGDRGCDFVLPTVYGRFVVDVKTSRNPARLLVERGKCRLKTIYVAAHYNDQTKSASLLGWQWGSTVISYEPRDTGYGVINHEVPRHRLREIRELHLAQQG